ncbi:MAG: alpha/beta hydrolase [Rhodoglobus sp.]
MTSSLRPILPSPAKSARRLLAASALLLTLPLAGCFMLPSAPSNATSTPTGEKVDAALAPYYSQVLTWKDCGDGAQCATAIAPMDWDHPSKSTDITLALARHTATGTRQGSLFVNPGGPGASGYDLVHDDVDYAVSDRLQAAYDVIGWDPRGVGRSTPVTCYDDKKLDDFIFGLPKAPTETPEWVAELTKSAVDFGQACLANTGPSLEFVDTQSTVHDLDMLRAIVGDKKLHYLGYSYGSDIGMYYIDRFASKVGRVVLDGSTDSTVTSFDVGLTQTAGFELALRNYLTACPETDDCPFTGDLPTDLATIQALYDQLDANPVAAPDGRMMDAGVLDVAMSMALYDQSSWPYLSDLFTEAPKGITDTAFFLADYYYSRDVDGTYADNSLEAFIAISCVDYAVVTDPAEIAAENAQLEVASPTTARTSSVGDLTCINWPFHYRGGPITAVVGKGAPDVIIVSTTGDPATPYQWGVALSKQLESAHLITNNGEGHTAYNGGVACVDDAVDDYFVNGTVPKTDPNCGG